MKIRIYYEDTDAAGIVYYANYLKFCERARSEVFFAAGSTPQGEEGYFVVKKIEAEYHQPAKLGEMVEVQTNMVQKRGASITLRQRVLRDETPLFEMLVTLVYLKNGRPGRIPPEVQSLICSWEKGE